MNPEIKKLDKRVTDIEHQLLTGKIQGSMFDSMNYLVQMIKKQDEFMQTKFKNINQQSSQLTRNAQEMISYMKKAGVWDGFIKEQQIKMQEQQKKMEEEKNAKEKDNSQPSPSDIKTDGQNDNNKSS